jgi:hypothetical protein
MPSDVVFANNCTRGITSAIWVQGSATTLPPKRPARSCARANVRLAT